MRAAIDGMDWTATPLGERSTWPASLRALVSLMLDSPEAMVVWWGDDMCQIYNDAYAPRIGSTEYQTPLGKPAADYWKDSWATVGPQVQLVLAGYASKSYENFLIRIDRNGRVEDTYWTYSFTPVRDDAGVIGGVLVVSTETTEQVLGVRRQTTLDWLRQRVAGVESNASLQMAVAAARDVNRGDFDEVAAMSAAEAVEYASRPIGTRVCITSTDLGVDTDIAVAFALSQSRPVDTAFRLFLEQFTLLVANARHRIDIEERRRIVEAERDRLLLD